MCLALPGKIVSIDGAKATVDYGGVKKEADLSLLECKIGDYVLVHTGFAIQKVDKVAAEENLRLWKEAFDKEESGK